MTPNTKPRSKVPLFWILAISTLILDQVVKAWVRGALHEGQSWPGGPIPGILEITLTYNKGIAFGMFQGMAKLMTPIALAIAGAAAWHSHKHKFEGTFHHIAMALLASGAIGNLIDRLFNPKGVTDMFLVRFSNITEKWPFHLNDFPVFNVADSCISIAMCFLIVIWWREGSEKPQSKSAIVSESVTATTSETPVVPATGTDSTI